MGGVGEYTGKKRQDKHSALEKFIDDYHFRQTPVIVILDREGRVEAVTHNLLTATSKLYRQRMLTKPEYLQIWKRSIEFDNFTHSEIAARLTKLSCTGVRTRSADEGAALLRILDDVIDLAALNHQPDTVDTWKMNQESGYFGALIVPKS